MAEDLKKWTLVALESARKLEKEGYEFYTQAAQKTLNREGREMFEFLAVEEIKHYKIVDNLMEMFGGSRLPIKDEITSESGIFNETRGGSIGEKADQLDALNIGIKAEQKSIEAYSNIYDKTNNQSLKKAAKKLIQEEKKHLSILEAEVEFITDTGEYHDFRTITM